jgi:hypothetical protein
MKYALYFALALAACYVGLCAIVLTAMLASPARFGQFMRRMPPTLVWGALPARRMWLWARRGSLVAGVPAPDFTLPRQGRAEPVTLSSFRGRRPVVVVFGSYT